MDNVKLGIVVVSLYFDSNFFNTIESLSSGSEYIDELIVVSPQERRPEITGFKRVTFIKDEGRGVYPAMNQVLKNDCVTDLLLFLNSGDELLTKEILIQAKSIDLESTDGIVAGYETRFRHRINPASNWILGGRKVKSNLNPRKIKQSSFIMKCSVLRELQGFNCNYSIGADYDLIRKLVASYKIKKVNIIATTFYLDGLSSKNRCRSLRQMYEIDCSYSEPSEFMKVIYLLKMVRAFLIDTMFNINEVSDKRE